jgi:hypothetical protein
MNIRPNIVILTLFALFFVSLSSRAQEKQNNGGYLVPVCIYEGDTIPYVQLRTVYIFKPLKFKNDKERREYYKLVRNVKKVYPIAREINHPRNIRISTNPAERKSPATSHQKGREGPQRTIYATHEEINFCTR